MIGMKVKDILDALKDADPEMELVIDFSSPGDEHFSLCPLASVSEVETDLGEKFIMMTGLNYQISDN